MDRAQQDWVDWLALSRLPGLGPVGMGHLMRAFPTARAALEASRKQLESVADFPSHVPRALAGARLPKVEESLLASVRRLKLRVLTLRDPIYPMLLRLLSDAPPLLFVEGDPTVLSRSSVAVVGSRNCSAVGRRTAEEIAYALAGMGHVVVSGLARGIDGAAHRGALGAEGETVAVMGCGLDQTYPAANRELRKRVARQGAVVAELPPGAPPAAENFPRRNRIISGLSRGVILLDARGRSGSLITADCALDQGREVLVVPGPFDSPYHRGCARLLRQGATPLTEMSDLATLVGTEPIPEPVEPTERTSLGLTPEVRTLAEAIPAEGVSLDELLRSSRWSRGDIQEALLLLELSGVIRALPGGGFARCRTSPGSRRYRKGKDRTHG